MVIKVIIFLSNVSCAIIVGSIVLGSAGAIAGSVALGAIKLAEIYQPYKQLIKKEVIYSTEVAVFSCALGLVCLGTAALQDQEELLSTEKSLPYMPKACVGCRNFHGLHYGQTQLICAIHPYGSADEICPDWEGFTRNV